MMCGCDRLYGQSGGVVELHGDRTSELGKSSAWTTAINPSRVWRNSGLGTNPSLSCRAWNLAWHRILWNKYFWGYGDATVCLGFNTEAILSSYRELSSR